jgi:Na+/H+ antiporter NhaC
MRPVTDSFRISRAKLAYIVDSTAAPVCILVPISTWVVEVMTQLRNAGIGTIYQGETFLVFLQATLFNAYPWLALVLVFWFCSGNKRDFGPMRQAEDRAEQFGDLGAFDNPSAASIQAIHTQSRLGDALWPILALYGSLILIMLYSGDHWILGGSHSTLETLKSMHMGRSMFLSGVFGVGFTLLYYRQRKLMSWFQLGHYGWISLKTMAPVLGILILAWALGRLIREDLQTGAYLATLLTNQSAWIQWLPFIIFLLGCAISFTTGTSWGTFNILIPIAIPMIMSIDPQMLPLALGAILAGSIYGDHASPLSDTTILSSTGSGVRLMDHVTTQAPYAALAAAVSGVFFILASFQSFFRSYEKTILLYGVLVVVMIVISRTLASRHNTKAALVLSPMAVDEETTVSFSRKP